MAEMETVEDKATEIVLNAVKNIPLIGCDPTLILENSTTDLIEILVKSIEKEHWFKKLKKNDSKCNTRNTIGVYITRSSSR